LCMTREFIILDPFWKSWVQLGLDDDDLHQLELFLFENPQAGTVIPDSKGIRKLRIPLKGKGKKGGGRV